MKIIATISILILLFFEGCRPTNELKGNYVNGNNIYYNLTQAPKKFEYFLKGEMGTLQYSSGIWKLVNNKLYLFGFEEDNLKILDIESAIKENVGSNGTKIEIHYNTDNAATYIKSFVLVNDSNVYRITKDTILSSDYKVETIQVKSYLSYTGLLSSSPKIDTLYSSKINVDNGSSQNQSIILKFAVHSYDFVRVKLTDTLTVKNSRILYHNKTKLKKSIQ